MKYDVVIIGSGPAGLGAAIYGARAGLQIAVLDKSPISGGQVLTTYEVDNYLGLKGAGGAELSDRFRQHADALQVPFITEEVCDIKIEKEAAYVVTAKETYETKTVILATGAHHAKLGVKGEQELSGMGVSYCATCDGAFFKNRTVAVIGGGDVAVEDAIYLAGICKKVYLIHRRDTLRAAKSLQEKMYALDNVVFCKDSIVTEIAGEDCVETLFLQNVKTEEKTELPVDGVFIAVGVNPETELVKELAEMDEQGYVIAGEDCQTSCERIFAAGDIRKKPLRQIITAVADGANAIAGIQNFLNS